MSKLLAIHLAAKVPLSHKHLLEDLPSGVIVHSCHKDIFVPLPSHCLARFTLQTATDAIVILSSIGSMLPAELSQVVVNEEKFWVQWQPWAAGETLEMKLEQLKQTWDYTIKTEISTDDSNYDHITSDVLDGVPLTLLPRFSGRGRERGPARGSGGVTSFSTCGSMKDVDGQHCAHAKVYATYFVEGRMPGHDQDEDD